MFLTIKSDLIDKMLPNFVEKKVIKQQKKRLRDPESVTIIASVAQPGTVEPKK